MRRPTAAVRMPRLAAGIVALHVLFLRPGAADEPDPTLLTLERIFASSDFDGERSPGRWLDDGSALVTLEDSEGPAGGRDIVRHDPRTGAREVLVEAALLVPSGESSPLRVERWEFSPDMSRLLVFTESKRVWRRNTRGDYWVLDRSARELRKLGGDAPPSSLMFAKFSPDGGRVAYVSESDIFVEDLGDGAVTPLTTGGDGTVINGTFDWVYEEELGLRDGFRWSPDGRRIAYWQIDSSGVGRFPLVDNTAGRYPRITWIPYPKVGERNSACRVGVVSAAGGETRWIDLPGDSREHYLARMEWVPGSEELLLQRLDRSQSSLTVLIANALTGEVRTALVERDDAWVDVGDDLHWLAGGERFTWVSERDRWRHIYLVSRSGDRLDRLTPGEFDVIRLLALDEGAGVVWFTASPEDPTREYLYRARLDGGGVERVTPAGERGTHAYDIAPGGRWAVHTVSTFDAPPVTDLVSLPGHERVRVLAENRELRERVEKLKRCPTEFFRVDIGDGVLLDAWCMKPPDLDPERKYPLLVYVYGEPAGQTVRDRWGGRSHLWHLMLAQRGYVVISFDNRGTPAPRGRAWRKSIHRQVGILASADQAAAVRKVLEERPYLDRDRVGVWGWSGGGSMSLNAVFRYPELYHAAIAVAPVPNQRLYDTIYQERYMGLPAENVEGYRLGSPITFAHQFRGSLLLVHGTGDDNVHYQGTEALVDELIRHGKQFDLMVYPNRTHAIREGAGTTMHLRTMMTRWLEARLPPGPRE